MRYLLTMLGNGFANRPTCGLGFQENVGSQLRWDDFRPLSSKLRFCIGRWLANRAHSLFYFGVRN
jgi:hypothetical protein